MSPLRKRSAVVGGCVLLWLTGCSQQPAAVKTAPSSGLLVAATVSPAPMPSYPILLVDLPRLQMGLPVSPALSRVTAGDEADLEGPALTLTSVRPAAPLVHSDAAPLVPIAPLPPRERIDTSLVP